MRFLRFFPTAPNLWQEGFLWGVEVVNIVVVAVLGGGVVNVVVVVNIVVVEVIGGGVVNVVVIVNIVVVEVLGGGGVNVVGVLNIVVAGDHFSDVGQKC